MRHLWSLLSGLAATAVVLALFSVLPPREPSWLVLIQLIAGGIVLGLVATPRISPVGPLVAGLLLLTPVVLMFTAVDFYAGIFRQPTFLDLGGGWRAGWLVLDAAADKLAVAGAIMIVAVISAQRWRAWPKPVDALVDNGPAANPWRRPLDDTVPTPTGANDGTTEQLWVQPR